MAASQVADLVAGAGAVEGEQHGHRVHRRRQVTVPAVQRLGGEVGVHRVLVAREGQSRDGLARGLERRAQPVGQRALARAVDTLDRDEHAASVSVGDVRGVDRNAVAEFGSADFPPWRTQGL